MQSTRTAKTAATPATPLEKISAIRAELREQFIERESEIDMLIVGAITGQHVLLLGPAGTGKSALISALVARISDAVKFDTMLTKGSTLEEVFGPLDLMKLKSSVYSRKVDGYLPSAHFAFVDECFKANSMVLNGMLRAMNERLYRNDDATHEMPLISLVGASNEMPQSDDLAALFDRFTLRTWTQYLSSAGHEQLLSDEIARRRVRAAALRAGTRTARIGQDGTTISLDELAELQADALDVEIPDAVLDGYRSIRLALAEEGLPLPSDRRSMWLLDLICGSAVARGRMTATMSDLAILRYALWLTPEQISKVAQIVMRVAQPVTAKAQRTYDACVAQYDETMRLLRTLDKSDVKRETAAVAARRAINTALDELRGTLNEARGAGEDDAVIVAYGRDLNRKKLDLTKLAGDDTNVADWAR